MDAGAVQMREGMRVTWVGVVVNAILIVVKAVAGVVGGSQALIADAVHSFSDFFTDGVVLVGLKLGRRDADDDHHFGHGRIETLASFLVGVALLAVAGFIGWRAGVSIYRHVEATPTGFAVAAAAFSILAKEWLYRYTVAVGRRIRSTAVVANAWHHRSDALSSVAVLLGVGAAWLNPAWHMLDSYAALIVSALILHVGVSILWQALKEFTDAAPDRAVLDAMLVSARAVAGVLDVHDLRVRTAGGLYQIELHVEVDGKASVAEGHRIAKAVQHRVEAEVGNVARMIVHVDPAELPETRGTPVAPPLA